jgi:hypothetical protein
VVTWGVTPVVNILTKALPQIKNRVIKEYGITVEFKLWMILMIAVTHGIRITLI